MIFFTYNIRSQVISEVLFNYPYESEYCQYIEIFNNTSSTIDLRYFSFLVQGYEIKITNLFLSDFETEGITNSSILQPNQFAVILPYSYYLTSKPFYFPSNTIILTTPTKYLGKTTHITKDMLSTIKLISNNNVLDSVNMNITSGEGVCIERIGSEFRFSQTPSYGFIPNDSNIWFPKQVYSMNEGVEVFLKFQTNIDTINIELVGKGNLTLNRVSENIFRGILQPTYNGDRIVAKFGNITATTRTLNLFELSPLKNTLLINEICFLPSRRWLDYFQGGSGIGTPREIDKYFEIINVSSNRIYLTNTYLHCLNNQKEIILGIKENIFYSSQRGFSTNLLYIEPYEYILVSSPNISGDMIFLLKDNHPYRGGKIIHFCEPKDVKIIPFSHSNTFSVSNKPTISLLPNGFPTEFGGRFLNWSETPSRYNGFSSPSIVFDSKFKKIEEKINIYLVDEIFDDVIFTRIHTKNTKISRSLVLTNMGFWYYGEFTISTNPLDPVYVSEEDEVVVEYNKSGFVFYDTFFVIPQDSIQISKDNTPILEKGILKLGENIRFINVMKGDIIRFFTTDGFFIKEFVVNESEVFEISSLFLSRRGIYIIEVDRKGIKNIYKVVILAQ